MYLGKTGQQTQTCHANLNNIPQEILKKYKISTGFQNYLPFRSKKRGDLRNSLGLLGVTLL